MLSQDEMYLLLVSKYAFKFSKAKKQASYMLQAQVEAKEMQLEEAITFKRDASKMDDAYNPLAVEKYWNAWWEQNKFFHADPHSSKTPFCICLPPPNVTGYLHIGHALTIAIEDSIVRMKRMQGFETLFIPGTDHAGIATQTVAEKQLFKEKGLTRHDLGRQKFLEVVWEFKQTHGNGILNQLRRTGGSLDWDRLAFTMDEQLSTSVIQAFVRLYEKDLIYRANRLVNWSTILKTAISDIEVDHIDLEKRQMLQVPGYERKVEFGVIVHFCYPLKEDPTKFIEVATTRIETMLGDTAVAVHPQDQRYKHLIGKELLHPFIPERVMRIIADDFVEKDFGTGAVKITPAHDQNDYACGQRNNLEFINIFTEEGKINSNGGKYEGMKRFDCRRVIEEDLKKLGLFKDKKDNKMRLGLCSRSHDVIEPIIKPQWYVKCTQISKQMMEVVKTKELKITPVEEEETWYRWVGNLKDWCVSRQLWWGHRIPVYLCFKKGNRPAESLSNQNWIAARSTGEAIQKASKLLNLPKEQVEIQQDNDVLDTWFSSGLFPFSTLKWPNNEHPDFQKFFPNSILETGHDILFFWVARMVMMSLWLTGKLPFKQVLLHPLVCDSEGNKMSKSRGNVIDPIEIIEGTSLDSLIAKVKGSNLGKGEKESSVKKLKYEFPQGIPECGSDALRFGLLAYMVQGRSINLNINRIISYRKFCNKIWNSFKFSMSKFSLITEIRTIDPLKQKFINSWILAKLNKAIWQITSSYERFSIGEASVSFHNFWLYELCDIYLQATKPLFVQGTPEDKQATALTLFTCLETGVRLLHPMMPFLTEELYQKLPDFPLKQKSITIAAYPVCFPNCQAHFESIEAQFDKINKVAAILRSIAASVNLPPHIRPEAYIITSEEIIKQETDLLSTLGRCGKIHIIDDEAKAPKGCGTSAYFETKVFLALGEHINVEKEVERLQKKAKELGSMKEKVQGKIHDKNRDKIPESVREEQNQQLQELNKELQVIGKALVKIRELK